MAVTVENEPKANDFKLFGKNFLERVQKRIKRADVSDTVVQVSVLKNTPYRVSVYQCFSRIPIHIGIRPDTRILKQNIKKKY